MSIELDEAKLRHPSSGVLQEVIATNSVRAFNSGVEHGAKLERGRIVKLLEEVLEFDQEQDKRNVIALITGESK